MPECKTCKGTGAVLGDAGLRCGACDGWGRVDELPEMIAKNFAIATPIGTECIYFSTKPFDRNLAIRTKISSAPWVLGSGHVVVGLDGMSGGKSIEHIAFETTDRP